MAEPLTPEEVERRIRSLTPPEWLIVRLHCLGYKNVEIARFMGRKPGGIGTWLSRACDKLGIRYRSEVERDAALNSFWVSELRKREQRGLVPVGKPEPDEPPIPEDSKAWLAVILERNLPPLPTTGDDIVDGDWRELQPQQLPPPRGGKIGAGIVGALLMAAVIAMGLIGLGASGIWRQFVPIPTSQVITQLQTVEVPITQTVVSTIIQKETVPPNTLVVTITTTPGPVVALPTPQPIDTQTPIVYVTVVTKEVPAQVVGAGQTPNPIQKPFDSTSLVPFAASSSPQSLTSPWRYVAGGSPDNNYRLSADGATVTLIAGRGTDFYNGNYSGPSVAFPASGDFEVQTRLEFDPVERYQVAGLHIRSASKEGNWISIRRLTDGGGQYVVGTKSTNNSGSDVRGVYYGKTTTYLKVSRINELFTLAFSDNGRNWVILASDVLFALDQQVEAVLFAYSTSGNGRLASFSDVRKSNPSTPVAPLRTGTIPFADSIEPTLLSSEWSFFPGYSPASTFRLSGDKLIMISGAGTNTHDGNSAPFATIPITGNFDAQLRVDFDPKLRYQLAGFALRDKDVASNNLTVRRWSDGGGQYVNAHRTINGGNENMTPAKAYPQTTVYFRIKRSEPLVTLAYSLDGQTWETLIDQSVQSFSNPAVLMLYVWSSPGEGISATFSNLTITPQ